jgi:hypothetical protein
MLQRGLETYSLLTPEPTFHPDFRALGSPLFNWARYEDISRKLEKEALSAK